MVRVWMKHGLTEGRDLCFDWMGRLLVAQPLSWYRAASGRGS